MGKAEALLYRATDLDLSGQRSSGQQRSTDTSALSKGKCFSTLHLKTQIGKSVSLRDSNGLAYDDNHSALLGINSSAATPFAIIKERVD